MYFLPILQCDSRKVCCMKWQNTVVWCFGSYAGRKNSSWIVKYSTVLMPLLKFTDLLSLHIFIQVSSEDSLHRHVSFNWDVWGKCGNARWPSSNELRGIEPHLSGFGYTNFRETSNQLNWGEEPQTYSQPQVNHRTIEYPKLEGNHSNHWIQLGLFTGTLKNKPCVWEYCPNVS